MFHNVYYLSLENLELQQATKAIRIENISSIILFYKKKNSIEQSNSFRLIINLYFYIIS